MKILGSYLRQKEQQYGDSRQGSPDGSRRRRRRSRTDTPARPHHQALHRMQLLRHRPIRKGRLRRCVMKNDDFNFFNEKFLDCDGMVVGSPIYEKSPSGQLKSLNDRMGPSHDMAFQMIARDMRAGQGHYEGNRPRPALLQAAWRHSDRRRRQRVGYPGRASAPPVCLSHAG